MSSPRSNLPPWDQLSFVFTIGGLTFPTSYNATLPQCSNLTIKYWGLVNGRTANPPPTPPYSLVLYSGGYEPLLVPMNNTGITGGTEWTVNLPVGERFAVSMKDSRGYSAGILDQTLQLTPGAGCDLNNAPKASSLIIDVNNNKQCQEMLVAVSNGVPPYMVEIIPLNVNYKTIYFAQSPFRILLDVSAGVEYMLAVYDSQGNSGAKGIYRVGPSSDNKCLGLAATVTAGKFSTMHPGGTALPEPTAASGGPMTRHGLPASTAISMAVLIPIISVSFALILLWLCFRGSSRYYPLERHNRSRNGHSSDSFSQYTPFPAEYTGLVTVDSSSGPISASTVDTKLSSSNPSRSFVNPDSHHLGPLEVESFDLNTLHSHNGIKAHQQAA